MYALALGVSHISSILPLPVYALLSGLNAAVVGTIALAAVQLSNKVITDPLSRLILVFSACAGLCYNALWYFPVLMVIGGMSTVVWDTWARNFVGKLKDRRRRRRGQDNTLESSGGNLAVDNTGREDTAEDERSRRSIVSARSAIRMVHLRRDGGNIDSGEPLGADESDPPKEEASVRSVPQAVTRVSHGIPVKIGVVIIAAFFGTFKQSMTHSLTNLGVASFISIMVANSVTKSPPLELRLFRNMYLAGELLYLSAVVQLLISYPAKRHNYFRRRTCKNFQILFFPIFRTSEWLFRSIH